MNRFFTLLFVVSAFFAAAQPTGYYDSALGLTGDQLKAALHNIIKDHTEYSYNDLRDFILKDTDEDPDNPNNVILLYTGRSQAKSTFGGGADQWNREHVWAKSHGNFGTSPPAGTDAHHIRPTDVSVNSDRGNKDFDNGGQQHPEATGCYYDNDSWEPRDEVKGDVARMIFYMAVRYEGGNGEPDLEVVDQVNTSPAPQHGKFSTLYEWHQQDPPDAFEIHRNDVIYSYQGNRNPFIDHPEFLAQIYDPTNATVEFETLSLSLYPNPAGNIINLRLTGNVPEHGDIFIHDILGQTVCNSTIENNSGNFQMDISDLPNGLYFVSLNTTGNIRTMKLNVRH